MKGTKEERCRVGTRMYERSEFGTCSIWARGVSVVVAKRTVGQGPSNTPPGDRVNFLVNVIEPPPEWPGV